MIKLNLTMTCTCSLASGDEYNVLKEAHESGITIEEAVIRLQKAEVIDVLYGSFDDEVVQKIEDVTYEEDEEDCERDY